MKERVTKVVGHAEHLLDGYLGLRMSYALLAPLLTDSAVTRRLSAGTRRQGFASMRYALLPGCALDVVKLALDRDDRTPSINNLMAALSELQIVEALKLKYSRHPMPRRLGDEEWEDALQEVDAGRERELGDRFDGFLGETRDQWATFQSRAWCDGFARLRDKHVAHLEIRLIDGQYRTADLAALGLKWTDVGEAVEQMEPIVWKLNVLTRADFDMASAVESFRKSGEEFWS